MVMNHDCLFVNEVLIGRLKGSEQNNSRDLKNPDYEDDPVSVDPFDSSESEIDDSDHEMEQADRIVKFFYKKFVKPQTIVLKLSF